MIARRCLRCPRRFLRSPAPWRCTGCGGPLDYVYDTPVPPLREAFLERGGPAGMPRWAEALPLEGALLSRGEGAAPLVEEPFREVPVRLLLDYLNPTGSYKDRGAALMVSDLRAQRGRILIEDSSGNAGAAVAMYGTAAGRSVRIYAPASASPGKLALIERFPRARVVACEGSSASDARAQAARRAVADAALPGRLYASHVWQPGFRHGVKTAAWEIASACRPQAPAAVVFPVGNGVLALGLSLGFFDLLTAGLIDHLPALIGVQAAACAPVARAHARAAGRRRPDEQRGETAAEGIRVTDPPLLREIVAAVVATRGKIVTVKEAPTRAALAHLWRRGYPVEFTSAVVAAVLGEFAARWRRGLAAEGRTGPIVGILTGSGLKSAAPRAGAAR